MPIPRNLLENICLQKIKINDYEELFIVDTEYDSEYGINLDNVRKKNNEDFENRIF